MKSISAAAWITPSSAPTVVVYGTYGRVQPFNAPFRLNAALKENGVDHKGLALSCYCCVSNVVHDTFSPNTAA